VIYLGGCPNSVPSQIGVDFQSRGGGLVFAVRDSIAAIDARWVSNDTLAIQYPASVAVDQRRAFSQYGRDRVEVVYRPIP